MMMKHVKYLVLLTLLAAQPADAQGLAQAQAEERLRAQCAGAPGQVSAECLAAGLTEAILDLTTTPQRHLYWQPCGERFRGRDPEAVSYAQRIARAVAREAGRDLDPWTMLAQLQQESGMNPCVFSSREFRLYRASLGRRPSERDVLRLLTSSRLREQHQIRAMDAGLAQFRWPGAVARRVGITTPEQLLDIDTSVHAYAQALRRYRRACENTPVFQGTYLASSGRVVRWSYACTDVFWAIHNTGSPTNIRYEYVSNVRRRYRAGPGLWRAVVESRGDG
jgi:hypothetical protein